MRVFRCLPLVYLLLIVQLSDCFALSKNSDTICVTPSLLSDETKKPLLAIKTNLLLDAITAINLEIEVPINKRWSVAAEVICPWWLLEEKQYCFQVLSGNIECRYWLGNRNITRKGDKRKVLTGWFAGIYAGYGIYDLEWGSEGYKGGFFMSCGVNGGYSHSIGKNLRMEYAVGVGYLQTKYDKYTPINGGEVLVWQHSGEYSMIGVTRAKVSLVWMINYKVKRGGIKR